MCFLDWMVPEYISTDFITDRIISIVGEEENSTSRLPLSDSLSSTSNNHLQHFTESNVNNNDISLISQNRISPQPKLKDANYERCENIAEVSILPRRNETINVSVNSDNNLISAESELAVDSVASFDSQIVLSRIPIVIQPQLTLSDEENDVEVVSITSRHGR